MRSPASSRASGVAAGLSRTPASAARCASHAELSDRKVASSFFLSCVQRAPTVTASRSVTLKTLRSEEHTSELQSLMRISYAVFCLKKKKKTTYEQVHNPHPHQH